MKEISIIVPVYNVEKYIRQCLESLLSQTFDDYEILVIDDGSTDSSYSICMEYESNDRVRLFHRENHGISKTRAFGVSQSCGKWILFVDSDDYVEKNFCERLHETVTKEQADIAECNYIYFNEDGVLNPRVLNHHSAVYEKEAFVNAIVRKTIVSGSEAVVVWNKIYRREGIITFVLEYGESPLEDYLFNMQYYQGVKKYCFVDEVLIHYRKTAGSLTKKPNPRTFEILKQVQSKKNVILENMGISTPADEKAAAQWFVNYIYQYMTNIALSCPDNVFIKKEVFDICSDPVMVAQCACIAEDNQFAGNVVQGKILCEYHNIKKRAKYIKLKRYINAFLRKNWRE